jgi:hypothetical protein
MGGKSTSSQDQTTEQQDNRIAAAENSVNLVASRSNMGDVTVVSTDHNTVAKSFDFAREISKNAANTSTAAMTAVQTTARDAFDEVAAAYGDVADKIAGAYTEAKAGEQKILVGGALLIGSIVALAALKKG